MSQWQIKINLMRQSQMKTIVCRVDKTNSGQSIMSDLKGSLDRIKAASKTLENSIKKPETSESYMQSLHDVLTEINSGVEQLKSGVQSDINSPIKLKKEC